MPEALVRQQLVDGALVLEDGAEVVVAAAARAGSKEKEAWSHRHGAVERRAARTRSEEEGERRRRKSQVTDKNGAAGTTTVAAAAVAGAQIRSRSTKSAGTQLAEQAGHHSPVEDCHLLVRQRGGDLAQALARALGGVALEKGPD